MRPSYAALACPGTGGWRGTGEEEIHNLFVAPFECRHISRMVGIVIGKIVQVTLDLIDGDLGKLMFM